MEEVVRQILIGMLWIVAPFLVIGIIAEIIYHWPLTWTERDETDYQRRRGERKNG